MDKLIELIGRELETAFERAGWDRSLGRVSMSNRPDLCEYQCNGAMAGAKLYHCAPMMIASGVVKELSESSIIGSAEAAAPGFINLKLRGEFLAEYLRRENSEERLGLDGAGKGKKIVIDYGGPNVAKPLHIGHLRSAIIGESMKRILRYNGYEVVSDVHLGDWGLQMGLIIARLQELRPELPYFDPEFTGEYPAQAPFTIGDLERIYPEASAKSKTDEAFAAKAHEATARLQRRERGYFALFRHIINVSVSDLKKNYAALGVDFDVWKGESDAQEFIPAMLDDMRSRGILRESEGAMVIDVAEESDAKEIPPCIVIKSDGASLYATTDLATLVQRERDYHPDGVLYVVDKRQEMHFIQVFRAARKAGIVRPETWLYLLGFGTMNGRDGKPFKTREGGVMRLESLISDTNEAVLARMRESGISLPEEEMKSTAALISMAAIKYGDLSNQATKDYIFDLDRFTSFEGNTGPYILYTMVRIKSILRRYRESGGDGGLAVQPARSDTEKSLQLALARANEVIENAAAEYAPHRLCQYVYEISNAFNSFYHETKILSEADEDIRSGYIALLSLTEKVLGDCIGMLGFSAPERM